MSKYIGLTQELRIRVKLTRIRHMRKTGSDSRSNYQEKPDPDPTLKKQHGSELINIKSQYYLDINKEFFKRNFEFGCSNNFLMFYSGTIV